MRRQVMDDNKRVRLERMNRAAEAEKGPGDSEAVGHARLCH
jgi:hypothetical protein